MLSRMIGGAVAGVCFTRINGARDVLPTIPLLSSVVYSLSTGRFRHRSTRRM